MLVREGSLEGKQRDVGGKGHSKKRWGGKSLQGGGKRDREGKITEVVLGMKQDMGVKDKGNGVRRKGTWYTW